MSYNGLSGVESSDQPHLGGNVYQGDPHTFCPSIWNYVIDRFCLRSVLDLGSGRGYAASYFYKKGLQTIAVDGFDVNVQHAIYPTIKQDLTKNAVSCKVDLVHCHEVVEHIEEKYLHNLLESLSCGTYILMTHAMPGQYGYHHVNLQPKEYWVKHLQSFGYNLLEEDTNRIRKLADIDNAVYMKQSGLFFAKGYSGVN